MNGIMVFVTAAAVNAVVLAIVLGAVYQFNKVVNESGR